MKVTIKSVANVVIDTLTKVGVNHEDANIILNTIVFANRRGVNTHGVGRLPLYIRKIQAGHYDPANCIEIVSDSGAVALLDAHNCFGQVAGKKAIDICVAKASEYGVAAVGVRNSNNFGTAGYFGDMAARQGFAALIFANAAPAIAPTGGNKTIFGTNPLCFAFPGTETLDPILLDMATTVAARGKIRLAAKNGEKIPLDWATGPDGKPTDDPLMALQGTLLPIGGYKGYGLSMFVDLFAGLLCGSAFGGNVKNLSDTNNDSGNGHLFILIDVHKFMSVRELTERLEYLHKSVKACGSPGSIFMPGELEYNRLKDNIDTIQLSEAQFDDVNGIACSLNSKYRLENAE